MHNNSELYETGGDANYGFKRFSLQLGALTLPQPAAELDMAEIQAGRTFADYISAIGGDASSGNGGALASLSRGVRRRCLRIASCRSLERTPTPLPSVSTSRTRCAAEIRRLRRTKRFPWPLWIRRRTLI